MKYLNSLVVIAMLIAAIAFSSCTKMKEDKIAETWRLIRVSVDSTITWYELWQFDGKNIFQIKQDSSLHNLDTIAGTYSVKAGLSKTIVTIQGFNSSEFDGEWEILKLNNDFLIMLLNNDFVWEYREFVKE